MPIPSAMDDAAARVTRFPKDIPPGATARDLRRKLYEMEQRGARPRMTPEKHAGAGESHESSA